MTAVPPSKLAPCGRDLPGRGGRLVDGRQNTLGYPGARLTTNP
jgi:hypothetical protein